MFKDKVRNLFIHSFSLNVVDKKWYVEDQKKNNDDYKFIEPIIEVDSYYKNIPENKIVTESILINGERVTSATLLIDCLNKINVNKDLLKALVLVQSFPDRQSGNPPLARILELSQLSPSYYYGITHLGSVGSLGGLEIIDLLLEENENATLLATEQLIIKDNRYLNHTFNSYGDAAVGLELWRQEGPIEILKYGMQIQKSVLSNFNLNTLKFEIQELIKQLDLYSDYIILQNLDKTISDIDFPNLYRRKNNMLSDFQSSDVWYTLGELIDVYNPMKGKTVLLVAINRNQSIAYVHLKIHDIPEINYIHY
ncbi:hypothetical protein HF078_10640 [Bacillus sp. RO2]|uniref:hypothetical protein n=1 Tax=Bacillus sp. RO2 TaxID=2723913 RepID=UPI00145E315E|nr:hypothetical protein [Bacillus sp. RO2]NMH73533.1 hypothetical protein [Bacillus sp. RO2]